MDSYGEQKIRIMEHALSETSVQLRTLREVNDIGRALLEASTIPSVDALREIVRALGFRTLSMGAVLTTVNAVVDRGMEEPEAEEAEGYDE